MQGEKHALAISLTFTDVTAAPPGLLSCLQHATHQTCSVTSFCHSCKSQVVVGLMRAMTCLSQGQLQSSQEREAALEQQLSAATLQLQEAQKALQAEQARLQEVMQSVSSPC